MFFGVGGPSLISSFHAMGEIFDKVYPSGSFHSGSLTNVQTVMVSPGGATVVELRIDEPGHFPLVDHALSRVEKGAAGTIEAF